MALYKYYASDKYGINFYGQMNANNIGEVIERLKKRKIMPIRIKQVNKKMTALGQNEKNRKKIKKQKDLAYSVDIAKYAKTKTSFFSIEITTKIKIQDVIVFTQNLYLLKKADFNNVQALQVLLENTENIRLKAIIEDILSGVEAGQNIYSVMEYYPDVFPPIFIGIIKSGELSGNLVNSFEQARKYLESSNKLKQKLKSILLPNVLQFIFINLLLVVGIIFIVPQIDNIYQSFGLTDNLPKITVTFGNIVRFIGKIWYVIVTAILAIIIITFLYVRTPEGKYKWDLGKYKVPIFGKLVVLLDTQKFLNALKLNLQNGIRLQESIEISKEVIKNTAFLSVLEIAKNNLIMGDDWIEPFERIRIFPNMIPEMLRMGMSSDLAEMIDKIEEYVLIDIDRKLNRTIKVLPQVSYAFVGAVIIIFVLVIMVPIMQVYMGSFLFDAYL